jgi:hypothetical protein
VTYSFREFNVKRRIQFEHIKKKEEKEKTQKAQEAHKGWS